jgi:hypothetical protein
LTWKKKGAWIWKTLFSEIKGFLSAQMDFEKKTYGFQKKPMDFKKKPIGFKKKCTKKRIFSTIFYLIFFSKSKVTFLVTLLSVQEKKKDFPFFLHFLWAKGKFFPFSTENVRRGTFFFFSCTIFAGKKFFFPAKKIKHLCFLRKKRH